MVKIKTKWLNKPISIGSKISIKHKMRMARKKKKTNSNKRVGLQVLGNRPIFDLRNEQTVPDPTTPPLLFLGMYINT